MPGVATARRMNAPRRAIFFLCALSFVGAAPGPPKSADPSRAAARAATCESCHGTPERAPLPGTPYLAGQQYLFLEMQMFLFREGLRDVPQMAGLFKDVTDRDFADIGAYFARQTPPRGSSRPDPKLHARGAVIARDMACGSCHLPDYRGQKHVPRVDNQPEDYLVAALKAYRDNKRSGSDTSMNAVLYRVPDGDLQALAHYLAHQQR
jgi:cytochrome c553